jgi:nitroreductase
MQSVEPARNAVIPTPATSRPRCGVDLMDAIYQRRAVRAYTPRKVGADEVRALIDAAIQAPSAVNQQPWAFVVIQDAALLRRLSGRAKELSLAGLRVGTPLWNHRSILSDPAFDVFYDAGTLIVICAKAGTSSPANEDCCLAAQNLMLAAYGRGLGTCPIGFAREALNEPAAKRELGIPDDHAVVMPILVGYPRETPAPVQRDAARVLSWK